MEARSGAGRTDVSEVTRLCLEQMPNLSPPRRFRARDYQDAPAIRGALVSSPQAIPSPSHSGTSLSLTGDRSSGSASPIYPPPVLLPQPPPLELSASASPLLSPAPQLSHVPAPQGSTLLMSHVGDEDDYFPLNLPEDRPDTPWPAPNLRPVGPREQDERPRRHSASPGRARRQAPPCSSTTSATVTSSNKATGKLYLILSNSFVAGIAVGVVLVIVKPRIEYYAGICARLFTTLVNYLVIWGSMAGIVYLMFRMLPQQDKSKGTKKKGNAETTAPVPSPKRKSASGASTSSGASSPLLPRTPSPSKSVDENYAFRPYSSPYGAKTGSAASTPRKMPMSEYYRVGEDVAVLERPVGESAFRLPRHVHA